MKTAIAAAALLFAAAADPAVALAQAVDADALYAEAVRDRQSGRSAVAIAKLETVLAARPDDVDARLNLGLALLAEGRLDEADAAFVAVLARAPGYADAHVGRARVAQRRGDVGAARLAASRARALQPNDPEIAALDGSLAAAGGDGRDWRIDAGYAFSSLGEGLPTWRETTVALTRRLDDRSSLGLAVEQSDRFGVINTYFEARYDRRFDWGGAYVAVGGTPDADYRPEVSLRAGGDIALGDGGTTLTLDGGVARYPSGTVSTLQPGLEQALFQGRLVLGARWINVLDETEEYRSGYSLRASWSALPTLRLRAGYADAPESSEGVTVDVKSFSLGFDADLSDRLTVRVNGLHEERDAYDRDEIAVGFGWRF
ncbi:MAG: tetratricopeptide repeat protein [Pseudomonadota bacterium]